MCQHRPRPGPADTPRAPCARHEHIVAAGGLPSPCVGPRQVVLLKIIPALFKKNKIKINKVK